ncbi:hypothetical protein D3C73_1542070 [compost metagenome]
MHPIALAFAKGVRQQGLGQTDRLIQGTELVLPEAARGLAIALLQPGQVIPITT